MTHPLRNLTAAFLLASALAPWPASASGTQITIKSDVPLTCGATVIGHSFVQTSSPLIIDVQVQQSCNSQNPASQNMSVIYVPNSPANPADLSMLFDGNLPTTVSPGTFTFAGQTFTNTVKVLRITYTGGTTTQGDQLATTITLQVTS